MVHPYSLDLRERVLQLYDEGDTVEDVAQYFSISKSWLYNLLKQRRDTSNITPKVRPTRYKTKLTPHEQEVRYSALGNMLTQFHQVALESATDVTAWWSATYRIGDRDFQILRRFLEKGDRIFASGEIFR